MSVAPPTAAAEHVHVASVRVATIAERALAFLAEPRNLSAWAVGMSEQRVLAADLVSGVFGEQRTTTYCRLDVAAAQRVVVYHLGTDVERLAPRIMAQVMAGGALGLCADSCVLSLFAWRTSDMDATRWREMGRAHETEVRTIKALLETC